MLKSYDEALDNYQQALTKEPNNVEFLKNRSQCFYDLGQYENSARDLDQALQQNSLDAQVLYKLGLTYYADKKYKKCIKTLKQALKNKPYQTFEADVYYHIGLAYCRVQKFEKSIWPYSRCIERVPSDIRYEHERAKAYQMIDYHEKAVEDFNNVLSRNPKNAHAHFRRAFSLKALKVSFWFGVTLFRIMRRQLKTSKKRKIWRRSTPKWW